MQNQNDDRLSLSDDRTTSSSNSPPSSKRPIPLPRHKLNIDMMSSSSSLTKSDSSSSISSKSPSIRKSLKNVSSNSKAVLERSRSKLKNVLTRSNSNNNKRNCLFYEDTEDEGKEGRERCQSLTVEVDDIFKKISFESPLDLGTQIRVWCRQGFESHPEEECHHSEQSSCKDDDDTNSSMTSASCADMSLFSNEDGNGNVVCSSPPSYPPPPLPLDVNLEDDTSSQDSFYTAGVIDTDSFYDEVIGTVSRMQNIRLEERNLNESVDNTVNRNYISRCDSWNFVSKPKSILRKQSDPCSQSVQDVGQNTLTPGNTPFYSHVENSQPDPCNTNLNRQSIASDSSSCVNTLSIVSESCGSYLLNHDGSDVEPMDADFSPESYTSHHYPPFSQINKASQPPVQSCNDLYNTQAKKQPPLSYENWSLPFQQNNPRPCYENWDLSSVKTTGDIPDHRVDLFAPPELPPKQKRIVHSQSVIFEFDPLFQESEPPDPPDRFDSIGSSINANEVPSNSKGENNSDEIEKSLPELSGNQSPTLNKLRIARWSSMKRVIKNFADNSSSWTPMGRRGSKQTQEILLPNDQTLERPQVNIFNPSALYNGPLYKSGSNDKSKDLVEKHFNLGEGKLSFSVDKSGANSKSLFSIESILSIKIVHDIKQSVTGIDVYCFLVSTIISKQKSFLLGASCTSERRVWMQKLLESLTPNFPSKLTAEYTRAGWCFLKEGVTNDWTVAWIVLHERTLYYCQDSRNMMELDLKKARCVALQEGDSCSHVTEGSEFILVDTPGQVIYLQMDTSTETQSWRHDIRNEATKNGPQLVDQQLTKDEIPTIVDKCINFVFAHGSMSEGIYRKCGSNSSINKLLALFRQDAWAVQLTRSEYTEYDVSNVLKRFLRDLPEPLFTNELHKHLCNATGMDCTPEDKCNIYRSLLEKLSPIHYVTVRKLMGHLYFIQLQKDRNLMSVENLASIWGPTLMHVESKDSVEWTKREAQTVADLISFYPKLFLVEEEELELQKKMMTVLERLHKSSSGTPQEAKPSGDLKIWIYLDTKNKDNSIVAISLDPSKEAGQICEELSEKMNKPGYELCLMESVCDGTMTRILHHKEKVLDVVLEWGYWDDADCKDNSLILTSNETLRNEIAPLSKQSQVICGELKFADRKSKSFKNYFFEFSQSKLCYYKDKRGSVQLGEWKIEDIIWYLGYEKKRNPQTRWAITFINKHKAKRSKESPFFGHTIAGCNKEEQCKWMAALTFGQYSAADLLPKANLM